MVRTSISPRKEQFTSFANVEPVSSTELSFLAGVGVWTTGLVADLLEDLAVDVVVLLEDLAVDVVVLLEDLAVDVVALLEDLAVDVVALVEGLAVDVAALVEDLAVVFVADVVPLPPKPMPAETLAKFS